jgi:hypothetical protein
MIKELTEKEVSYLNELRKYEGQWVAVLKKASGLLCLNLRTGILLWVAAKMP